MNAISELKKEHEAIKTTFLILEKIIAKMRKNMDSQIVQDLNSLVEFYQVFADKCHHGKEEDFLFPALMEMGVSKEGGPIGVMLAEHDEGRHYVRELKKAIERFSNGALDAIDQIALYAESYMELLKRHIDKEDNILFSIAERVLSGEKQAQLYEKFQQIEIERIGEGKHEEFHSLLDKLATTYL